jgi:hypothetical protein
MTFHETQCPQEDAINAVYPSFTCMGFAEPPDEEGDEDYCDGTLIVTGHHYIMDLVSGATIDTDEQEDSE